MHSYMSKIKRLVQPGAAAVAAVLVLIALGGISHDLLSRIEERSLFITGKDYFMDCLAHPAGLGSYIGRFLNQFLIFPWMGALLAVILLAAIFMTVRKAFDLPSHLSLLALVPPALLLASDMGLGYGIFTIKSQGWFFMGMTGYLASMLAVWAYRRSGLIAGAVIALLWSSLGYMAFGSYAMVATLCMGIMTIRKEGKLRLPVCSSVLGAAVLLPRICSSLYITIRPQDWFLAGIPAVNLTKEYFCCWGPVVILMLVSLAAAGYHASGWNKEPSEMTWWGIQAASVILPVAILAGFWFKDANFMAEMKMHNAIGREDWKEVVRIQDSTAERFRKSDEKVFAKRSTELAGVNDNSRVNSIVKEYENRFYSPSRLMVMYRNLALCRLGTQLDQMYSHKDGGQKQRMPELIPLSLQGGKEIYLNYGLYNYSYRWCMEDAVEYGWTPETLKYGAMSQIAAGNLKAAEKMLSKLEKSMFNRKWAQQQKELIENPAKLQASDFYAFIKQLEPEDSHLSNDVISIEAYIMNSFTTERPASGTPLYDQVALMWAMQSQNIPNFFDALLNWMKSHHNQDIPLYAQEAAYLYGNLEGMEEVNMLKIDKGVKDRYAQFMQYVQQHPVRSEAEMRYQYGKSFGKTFYYYYYFIRNLETY